MTSFSYIIKLVGSDWENRDYQDSRPLLDDRKRLTNCFFFFFFF